MLHPAVSARTSLCACRKLYEGGFILFKCITSFFFQNYNKPRATYRAVYADVGAKVVAGLWLTFRVHLRRRTSDNKQTCTHTGCTPNGLSRPSILSVYRVTWAPRIYIYVHTSYYIIPFM